MTAPASPSVLPAHLAVIMDGNGRWAQARGLPRSEGHKAGVLAAKTVVTECRKLGIPHLTLYTFSQENWGRPKEEIGLLFQLLVVFLGQETANMLRNGIRLRVLGDLSRLPSAARAAAELAVRKTEGCADMTVNLALNYSGREEILGAVRALLAKGIPPEALTEETFAAELYTAGQPDPDLVVRTGGEWRLSNFLVYQSVYSELYFTPVFWPDFGAEALRGALDAYAARNRRFGLTQEQIR